MIVKLAVLACVVYLTNGQSTTRKLGRDPGSFPKDCGPCGEPLLLTPLINAGMIQEAQNASLVVYRNFGRTKSHAGYFTVNEQFNSNMFFWFFEASQNAKDAPVVLWLQGGPGASSLFGAFYENGPFRFKGRFIASRRSSWNKNNNMIYIDNPVGTGFSFTKGGYAQNQTAVANDLYSALVQFFKLFPDLQKNPFYVTGESYAGKYVPAISYAIHKNNPTATTKINFQGFAIGNGLCDPVNQLKYGDYIYQLGLIDEDGLNQVHAFENKGINYIKNKQWEQAFNIFDTLINGDDTPYPALFYNLTGYQFYFNYLYTADPVNTTRMDKLFQDPKIRSAIHVGATPFSDGKDVFQNLKFDMMKSVADWITELLSNYRGIFYNGQLDIIVAYPLTENFLKNLNFSSAAEFKKANRHMWMVDNELAGYVKTAGNLTEILVRDAGHMVPSDQPKWAVDIISRLTNNKPFF